MTELNEAEWHSHPQPALDRIPVTLLHKSQGKEMPFCSSGVIQPLLKRTLETVSERQKNKPKLVPKTNLHLTFMAGAGTRNWNSFGQFQTFLHHFSCLQAQALYCFPFLWALRQIISKLGFGHSVCFSHISPSCQEQTCPSLLLAPFASRCWPTGPEPGSLLRHQCPSGGYIYIYCG